VSSRSRPRLGVPEGPYLAKASFEGLEHFSSCINRLTFGGYEIVRCKAMPDFEHIAERHQQIMAAEMARVHERWFVKYKSLYHEKTANLIREGQTISDEALREDLPGREALRQELMRIMEAEGIDLWIAPAARGTAPFGLESTGDPVMNLPWTHSGLPSMSLPSGFNQTGLPFGLQVIGKWYGDEQLLVWSGEMEKILRQ